MRSPLLLLALAGALALAGCDNVPGMTDKLTDQLNTATSGGSTAEDKATVNGKVFASADQVAIIATGGLNYETLARSDEKGVKGATVKFKALEGGATATAQTDTSGGFKVKVDAKTTYEVTATFKAKDETTVTLTGLVVVDGASESFELDVAHNLVASKVLSSGATKVDDAKLKAAVSKLASDMASVSKAPTPTSRAEAAAKFDEFASEETKTAVEAIAK